MNVSYSAFSNCVSDGWTFEIGDPNFLGWSICAAYAIAFIFALSIAWQAPFAHSHSRQERVFWGLISLLMVLLALNKQLDLQSLLTAAGRCLAKEQGWYEDRRLVQRDFILGMIAFIAFSGGVLFWILRGQVHKNRLPLCALAVLAAFVLTRAMHLYHVLETENVLLDSFYHILPTVLEILCPALIIFAALTLLRLPATLPSRSKTGL